MNINKNIKEQMVNYKYGKIYKIEDNTNGNIYIGSTCCRLLCQRLRKHVSDYKCYLNGKTGLYTTSFEILKNNDYFIELIEKVPCDSRDELTKREGHYIRILKCVNKCVPGRTRKEWGKKYYEDNKEIILKYQKEYREEHKEERKEYQKEYYEDNKEEKKLKQKEYKEEHKEEIKEYKKKLHIYQTSWGGTITSYECNLLRIDVDLFH